MEAYTTDEVVVEAETDLQAKIRHAGVQIAMWKEYKIQLEAEERKISKAKFKTMVAVRMEPIFGTPVPKTPSVRKAPATPAGGGRRRKAAPSTPAGGRKKKNDAGDDNNDNIKRAKNITPEEDADGETLLEDLEKMMKGDDGNEPEKNVDNDTMSALDRMLLLPYTEQ